MNTSRKVPENVYHEITNKNIEKAHTLLKPFLHNGDPEAQYIFGMHIALKDETAEEFDSRSLKFIQLSAKQNYPPALYRLGVLYQTGEGVEINKTYAYELFKQASDLGHGKAKISVALYLYSGANGIDKNIALARKYIYEAIEENVDGAIDLLNNWNSDDDRTSN